MNEGSDGREISVACVVAASAWVSVPYAEFATLRLRVAAAFPHSLTPGLLKQADEQSLIALLAVRQALDAAALQPEEIEEWGLIVAPRLMGRKRIAESFDKFRDNGAWSVTPNIIPHSSLHSPSGLVSQALQLHGPNFGVGGLPGAEGEALWAALPMIEGGRLPGVWMILTGWDRESIDHEGASCQAAVLGLRPDNGRAGLPRLLFAPSGEATNASFTLETVGHSLRHRANARWNLDGFCCSITFGEPIREALA